MGCCEVSEIPPPPPGFSLDSAPPKRGMFGGKKRKPAGWDTRKGSHGSFHRDGRAKEVDVTSNLWESDATERALTTTKR